MNIHDYIIQSDEEQELYSTDNERFTSESETQKNDPKKYKKNLWIMTNKFESEAEGLEFMKQQQHEWGLRKTTPNKIGVKKYYRCKNLAVRSIQKILEIYNKRL